jgi:biotin carboxyl carrier protein
MAPLGDGWLVRVAASTRLADDAELQVGPGDVGAGANPGGLGFVVGRLQPPARGRPAVVEVVVGGWRFELEVEDARRADLRRRATRERPEAAVDTGAEVRAIIPGRVISVSVGVGDRIDAGQALLVVEAMKMQNELRAPRAGVVERIAVGPGQTIELGDLLVIVGGGDPR